MTAVRESEYSVSRRQQRARRTITMTESSGSDGQALPELAHGAAAGIASAMLSAADESLTAAEAIRRLRASELRFEALANASGQVVWTASADGAIGDLAHWCAFTGQTADEARGWGWLQAIHADDREATSTIWRASTARLSLYETEYRLRRADGVYRHMLARGVPVISATGSLDEWVGLTTDITVRKQIEDTQTQLARSIATRADELEATFEAITDGVIMFDTQGIITFLNTTARTLLGLELQPEYTQLDMVQRASLFEPRDANGKLMSADEWPLGRILRGEVLSGSNVVDVEIRNMHGHNVKLNISGAPIRMADGTSTGSVVVFRDVTASRQLERRTHDSLDALLAMAETLVEPEDEAAIAAPGTADRYNGATRRLAELTQRVLGCERVSFASYDAKTRHTRPLAVAGLSPEIEARWWQEQENAPDTEVDPQLLEALAHGNVLQLDFSKPPFVDQPNPYNIRTMLAGPLLVGETLVGFISLDHGGKDHQYTEEERSLTQAVGKLAALIVERERLLRERAESQASHLALLQANQRMDDFMSMASHELRTPLTTLKVNVQLATRRLKKFANEPGAAGLADLLARADRHVDLLNRLVGDLLDVSRIQADKLELRIEPVELRAIVVDAVQEQVLSWPKRTVTLDAPEQSLPVQADADRIVQVVTNYLTNALKYSTDDAPVCVRLSVHDRRARLAVIDQGPGLPPEEFQRIWERFHRAPGVEVLSGTGVGLGLGLYISQTIISRHHGEVGVESIVGKGSTFWFELPLLDE